IRVSGDLMVAGGDGGVGGDGGQIEVDADFGYAPNDQIVALYGYTQAHLSGGDGTTSGGDGGMAYLYADYAYADGFPIYYGPGGPVLSHVPLDLSGGAGEIGGDGGYLGMFTD